MPNPLLALTIAALVTTIGLLLFWPDLGVFWRWQRARRMTARVLREDALKHIHNYELQGRRPTVHSIAGALNVTTNQTADLVAQMQEHGLLQMAQDELHLTPRGRDYALHIIRAHRLWERYLADETGFTEADWHDQAEYLEHQLSRPEVDALAAQLGNPTHDPHGDPIPTASGDLVSHGGRPLPTLPLDQPARIVHLEDEPDAIYAQLVAEGLYPGQEVRLLEVSPQRVRFWAGGDVHVLAPIVSANISAVPLPGRPEADVQPHARLTDLTPGQTGRVLNISPACRGSERRRLMDLGILPGTLIEAALTSPGGDPTAYRIRGTLIALRREQASLINLAPPEDEAQDQPTQLNGNWRTNHGQ